MRRKLALIIVPAMALSLLVALPGAHATGGCVAIRGPGLSEDQATCQYTADNHGRTGYWMALTPRIDMEYPIFD